jgi:hypothetical protein
MSSFFVSLAGGGPIGANGRSATVIELDAIEAVGADAAVLDVGAEVNGT